ncbi:MAG TPA: ATP synthase F0 subunit C [Planctomycetota bacterium]|nr:ATP synthase F0 subunit C [Planctomycetota bacterium]
MLKKVLAVAAMVAVLSMPAFAFQAMAPKEAAHAPVANEPGTTGSSSSLGMALGFGLAIAAFGGAISQSNAIAKAVDAVARQPEAGARIQGMMIIGLALIETLVIYMLLICFMWGGKIV